MLGPSPYGGTATRSNPPLHPTLTTTAEARVAPAAVFLARSCQLKKDDTNRCRHQRPQSHRDGGNGVAFSDAADSLLYPWCLPLHSLRSFRRQVPRVTKRPPSGCLPHAWRLVAVRARWADIWVARVEAGIDYEDARRAAI